MSKQYTVIGRVAAFAAGALLALSKDQAEARRHALRPRGKDVYEVVARVEFKRGETLGVVGPVDKRSLVELAPPEKAASTGKKAGKPPKDSGTQGGENPGGQGADNTGGAGTLV